MIHEFAPITNSFVSVPADMGHFNCASFLAGIIAGVLDSAKFVSIYSLLLMWHVQLACRIQKAHSIYLPACHMSSFLCVQNAKVTAHNVSNGDGSVDRTVFLIKFSAEVMSRERKLG